jgi:recombination protein RecT
MSTDLTILEKQFAPLAPKFDQVLQVPGVGISSQRLIRSVLISCERTPGLLDCTAQSLFNAAMSAACLGLECDGVTGQAFLIPFKNKGTPTAQLVIGFKGFNTLAARSGITISGEIVRDGDAFDFDEGEGWVKHKKLLNGAGRRTIGAWAKASSNDRPAVVKVLGIDDILAIKAKSPGAKRPDSPWNDPAIGFPAMAEKSAKRRLARAMPLNVMQLASRLDEAFEEQGRVSYITPDKGVIVEAEAVEQPTAAELTAVEPPPPPESTPRELGLVTDFIGDYDKLLAEAALKGTPALQELWRAIPYEFQVSLKAALDRRHKHTAAEADRE